MEIGLFVLGIVGILGAFSIWQNGRKDAVVNKVIHDFIAQKEAIFMDVEIPKDSGPFKDEFYDAKVENLYQNIGYQSKQTLYRVVTYKTEKKGIQKAWLQLRVEKLEATYIDWKKAPQANK
jgi:hypothetical protein